MDREFLEGVWSPEPVESRPEVHLSDWMVFEVKMPRKSERTRHFVGWSMYDRSGMVSSQIVTFDPTSKKGVTGSGRVYELRGPSGWTSDSELTWRGWMRINEVDEYVDVTGDMLNRSD